jgi:hypothetical protein
MKGIAFIIFIPGCFLFPTSLNHPSTFEGWRGIVPLHSTRADVERLLGRGEGECECSYYRDDTNLFFQYASGDCKTGGSGGWQITKGTVIRFTVVPKPRPQLSEQQIDLSKFSRVPDSEIEGVTHYINKKEGLSFVVIAGEICEFFYEPAAADSHLRCP